MIGALFHVMVPTDGGHRSVAVFNVKDQADLLRALEERLPSLGRDRALVAMNEPALRMLLRASVRRRR